MTPWPCHACDTPGIRNLGTDGYCPQHLAHLSGGFNPAVFALHGHGLPGRTDNPTDLTCAACKATWTGLVGEECGYCTRRRTAQLEHQAELVLTPPDSDPADTEHETRMKAWAIRMHTATTAGIIGRDQARTAWRRHAPT